MGAGAGLLVNGDPLDWVVDEVPRDQQNGRHPTEFINAFPMSVESRENLLRLFTDTSSVTMARHWGASEEILCYFRTRTLEFFGLAADYLPAILVVAFGYPGAQGLPELPRDHEAELDMTQPYIYHFPDGNASIARLLIRPLIPLLGGINSMEGSSPLSSISPSSMTPPITSAFDSILPPCGSLVQRSKALTV